MSHMPAFELLLFCQMRAARKRWSFHGISVGSVGRSFGSKITSWCTFNEPGVYTFSGYCMGSFPPGKHLHFGLAGRVLKHMLICHTEAYKLIKSMPGVNLMQPKVVLQRHTAIPTKVAQIR